jgi:hypothetical protein
VLVADDPLQIRVLRPGDDIDARLDLAERAFGAKGADEQDRRRETAPRPPMRDTPPAMRDPLAADR